MTEWGQLHLRVKSFFNVTGALPVYGIEILGAPASVFFQRLNQALKHGSLLKENLDLHQLSEGLYALRRTRRQNKDLCLFHFFDPTLKKPKKYAHTTPMMLLNLQDHEQAMTQLENFLSLKEQEPIVRWVCGKKDLIVIVHPFEVIIPFLPETEAQRIDYDVTPAFRMLHEKYIRALIGMWFGKRTLVRLEDMYSPIFYGVTTLAQDTAIERDFLENTGFLWLLRRLGYVKEATLPAASSLKDPLKEKRNA